MKRYISILLLILAVCAALTSCGVKWFDPNTGTEEADTTVVLPTLDASYDKNGDIILTSSENRVVYPTEKGYVIFSFLGDAVQEILEVRELEDESAAREYAEEMNADGSNIAKQNGKYVVLTVSFTPGTDDYGKYYTLSRNNVLSDFESVESN